MGITARDLALRRVVLWIAISAVFTALVIQFAYAHGKLVCPPFYDDVSYFEDALHRLEILYSYSPGAAIVDYVRNPPHSPFSSVLAAASFALMGVHDWAPYVGNGLVILGLVIFLDFLIRPIPRAGRLALTFIVLCVPICAMTVVEFRPDIPSALCTAMGATLLLTRSLTGSSWCYRVLAGALFGCGLLFKPPTSPLTGIIFATSLIVATFLDWRLKELNPRALVAAWFQCIASMILIPLPHYIIDWRGIYGYIYQNIFGPSHSTWARQGSVAWHLRYYLDGPGGQLMIGGMLWPLAAALGIGLVALIVAGYWRDAARVGGLLVVAAVAYAMPAMMDVKEPFFGTTFTWIVVFTAVWSLSILLRHRSLFPIALVVLLCAASLRAVRLGPKTYERGSPIVQERNRLVKDIYATLIAEQFPLYTRVYMTSTGFVNPGVFDYYYRRDTLHAFNIDCNAFSDDISAHQKEFETADYVIASESGNGEAYAEFVKSGLVQDQTLALIRANPDFQQIASFPTLTGKSYFLFRRTNPFCGWINPVGLIKPGAANARTETRSLTVPGASVQIAVPAASHPKLRFVARIITPDHPLHVSIKIDGRAPRRRTLKDFGKPEEVTFPFNPRGGDEHKVDITFDPPPDSLHPIAFTQLEIIPDEQK